VTWVIVIAGLVALVFLHELGHFSVALAVGMRPRSFYIGFPPALVKVKRRGIEYGIGMIPLGGLVRIPGMHRPAAHDLQIFLDPALAEAPALAPAALAVRRALAAEDYDAARAAYPELEEAVTGASLSASARRSAARALREVEEGTAPDAYWRAPVWKRVAVIGAGPLANVVVAFAILFVVFATSGAPTNQATATVASVQSGTPAAHAGLQAGDKVVAVDGTPATTFSSIARLVRSSHGAAITVTVKRDGKRVTLGPEATIHRGGHWVWGFSPAAQTVRYPLGLAASTAIADLGRVVTGTASGIGSLFSSHSRAHLTTVVGISRYSAAALRVSVPWYFEILGLVSMSLALLNLLPLLPLDGGHILFSLIEAVRRRALAREVYERVSVVGIALMLLVFVIAFSHDVSGHTPH
jgi:regulator of sigma E protease